MLNGNGSAPKGVVVGGSLGGLFNAIALGVSAAKSKSSRSRPG
jgi:hypothetical protein